MSEERFISPGSPVPPDVRELLECLIEECAEVQQRCTKALRFGLDEVQPGQSHTNADRIAIEVGDLREVVTRLQGYGVLSGAVMRYSQQNKVRQLDKFLQHQPSN